MTAPPTLGSPTAEVILYLPNAPQLPEGPALNLPALIQLNGNHWRKILTILAKLCAPGSDWRGYRDQHLLQAREAISFADRLQRQHAALHIIAGKASWERLGFNADAFTALDADSRIRIKDNIILTPYPDYRQFPNALIEQLKARLRRP